MFLKAETSGWTRFMKRIAAHSGSAFCEVRILHCSKPEMTQDSEVRKVYHS
jgi:hypothetical protein